MNDVVSEAFLKFSKEQNFQKRIDNLAKKYKGKKIVFYGAGLFSDVICENFDISKLNIIGVSDLKYEKMNEITENYKSFPMIKPSEITKYKPDVVLILLQEYFRAENYFKKELIPNKGKFKYESLFKIPIFDFLLMKFT